MITIEQINNLKEDDKLVLHSSNGEDYYMNISNMNICRPPEERFLIDIYADKDLTDSLDSGFYGKAWFKSVKDKLEII